MQDRKKELYSDVSEFDIITSVEFFMICDRAIEREEFDAFENSVCICADTGNIEALYVLFKTT